MSNTHEGISCDFCHKSGFTLRRYKCLLCYDYDLCGSCFDGKKESNNHKFDHPMQCFITKSDYGTFYAGENNTDLAFSYTCPICGKLGYTISSLHQHINVEHSDSNIEVICPICASLSEGNGNFQTRNLSIHINSKHNSLINNEADGSPKLSKKTTKSSRNVIESPQPNLKFKKTALSTNNEPTSIQGLTNPNLFGTSDVSDEPLLHTLLNQLYTWRTRKDNHTTLSRNQSVPDSRTNQDSAIEGSTLVNDDNATVQHGGISRTSVKHPLQDKNKHLRRKFGAKNIIDLTENWKMVDPDNELFSFDDDDIESISMSLNQAQVDDSEYLDEDEDMAPWSQDVNENIYNQIKPTTDTKSVPISSGNYIKSNSNNYFENKPNPVLHFNSDMDFKLPKKTRDVRNFEFLSTIDDKKISLNISDIVGNQGFLAKDVQLKYGKDRINKDKVNQEKSVNIENISDEQEKHPHGFSNERSQFIRDILLSSLFVNSSDSVSQFKTTNISGENDTKNHFL